MSVALAHQWLVTYRGGEKVLAEFRRLFPDAPLSSLVCRRGDIPDWILGSRVITSPLQRLPAAARLYKAYFPLHSWAFGRLNVPNNTTLVLSCDAAMVKGLRVPVGAAHVCYCNSPPRYVWDLQDDYLKHSGALGPMGRLVFRGVAEWARQFDYGAAQQVDHFIGNSRFIAERIRRCYGRTADFIYPPVSVDDFSPDHPAEDFYLLVTQLTPYKRADLAVRAFTELGKQLVVIGEGSEFEALKKIAGPTVQLLGRQPFKVVKDHFERCRAFLYPQVEDFGITAVEAQAAGRPVIAFRAGGALETVIEGETGLFFDEQTPESLGDAVKRFEKTFLVEEIVESSASPTVFTSVPSESPPLKLQLSPSTRKACRANAERFRPERFRAEVKAFLEKHYPDLFEGYLWPV